MTFENAVTAKELIQDEDITGTFVEMGSGAVIVDALCQEPGSSGTVLEGYYPNSKRAQQKLGVTTRSVSFQAMKAIIDQQVAEPDSDPDTQTILASSWQIPSSSPVETHGWMGIKQGEKELYAHARVTDAVEGARGKAQEVIAELGLELLALKGRPEALNKFLYLDQIVDAEGNAQIDAALKQYETIGDDREHLLYIDADQNLVRPIDFLRQANENGKMVVFKGSFNPVTNAHLAMAQKAEAETGEKPVFMISVNTRFKGKVDVENLRQRIDYISALGYGVMVCNRGGFVENTETLREQGLTAELLHICGDDTAARFEDDDVDNLTSLNAVALRVGRPGSEKPADDRIQTLEMPEMPIASTDIRNGDLTNLPETIRDQYLANNPKA